MRLDKGSSRARTGVSTVAGAVFFIAIMISVVVGLVVWTMDVQREMNELDIKRASQDIEISNVIFPSTGLIEIEVVNKGPEAVRLIGVWVIDMNTSTHYRVDLKLLYPDDRGIVIGAGDRRSFTIPFNWTNNHIYTIKLVSELGRIFAYAEARAPP